MSCLPKIYFKAVLTDPLEMTIVSATSLIVNRRFLRTKYLISMTCCPSIDVSFRPGHCDKHLCQISCYYRHCFNSDARFCEHKKRFFSIFTMSDFVEQRSCNKFCGQNEISANETLKMLQKAFGDQALSKTRTFE